jgi:hypothetical protein
VGVALEGGMHTLLQSPQCDVLLVKSTQEPSQFVVLPEQVTLHVPAAQTSRARHGASQSPQFALSDVKSTQLPWQSL